MVSPKQSGTILPWASYSPSPTPYCSPSQTFSCVKEKISQFAEIIKKRAEYKNALLGSLFIAVSTMCLFLSFNFAPASIASPISASYPVLTVLLSIIFLKEKLTTKNKIGIVLLLIAIVGIGVVHS